MVFDREALRKKTKRGAELKEKVVDSVITIITNEDEVEKILEKFPIYDVPETGCGHWTDITGDENNSRKIDIYEATEILERIGTDIECSEYEDDIEYHMIYDYSQEQGIPGLYIPRITYEYIINYIMEKRKL